ncbi:MAG: putative Ig domain-containing protein [Synergistaceae bacterium]|nr:putative Ig domain-containing protein [Synergistaceae bacterium]
MKKASVSLRTFALLLLASLVLLSLPGMATAAVPKWRFLWTILPSLNVVHTDGVTYRYSLTNEEIRLIREMSERTERFFEESSGNAVDVEMTVMVSRGSVTTLTENDDWLFVDEKDFPSDVKQEIERAEDAGVPYQLKVITYRLEGSDKLGYHGLGGGTCARARFLGAEYHQESERLPHPEEVWIHELLHCFEGFYVKLGYPMPDLHNAEQYGYQDVNGWYRWYQDIIAGKVRDPRTGASIGIKPDMWQYHPWEGLEFKRLSGHVYKLFNRVLPTWHEARDYCESLGGHLATITSDVEQDFVKELIRVATTDGLVRRGYWLGATNGSGEWRWITGELFIYEKFSSGQPDGSGGYLRMNTGWFGLGDWNETNPLARHDDAPDHPHGFICEWESELTKTMPTITADDHLPDGVVGTFYDQILTATGVGSIIWSLESGTLPHGMMIAPSGAITGTPTQPGAYNFTVKAANSKGYDIKTLTLAIEAAKSEPTIVTNGLPDAVVGMSYTAQLTAAGTEPITWHLVDGPVGLSLSEKGVLSWTPSLAGEFDFTVTATNEEGSDTKTLTLIVDAAVGSQLEITTESLSEGIVGVPYWARLWSNGTGVAWSLSSEMLPSGLTLAQDTGIISGTPMMAGRYEFTVMATTSETSVTRTLAITIAPAADSGFAILTTSLPRATVGQPYAITLAADRDVASWSVASGSLPKGLSLDPDTGTISGTPSIWALGTHDFTVRAVAMDGERGEAELTIVVDRPSEKEGDDGGDSGDCSIGFGGLALWAVVAFVAVRRRTA